jgi:hypothetical protein
MITRGIREFLARDWRTIREYKDDYWAARIADRGPAEALRIADELRRQVLRQQPGWPDAALRRQDLLCHALVAERLRRAGPTSSR